MQDSGQYGGQQDIRTLGIVGAGIMGMGIAQLAAQAGLSVRVLDAQPGAAQRGHDRLAHTLTGLQSKGRLSDTRQRELLAAIQPVDTVSDLGGCDVVIEAIVEDLAAKRALFAQLESVVAPNCILATNTSSLSVTGIAAGLSRPERVAGMHFFNPVPVMKLVEVVDGLLTDPSVGDALVGLGERLGHTAVRAQDTPGFIVNHAGRGYGTEALRILAEGVAEFHDVDRVLRETAGFIIGPFELMDVTALDVSHPVMEAIYRQYYEEPRYRPQPLTRQMRDAGLVGRKAGRGFYRYVDGVRQGVDPAPPPGATTPCTVWLAPDAPAPLQRLVDALGPRDAGAQPQSGSLCVVAPLGVDATTAALQWGLDATRTVAIESLFDLGRRRVLMTTPATTPAWRAAAHAHFAGDGVPVTVVCDSAGLIAQRVVAMIVNIACDMAQQRIATPVDIDRAVGLGLNYPCPPLAWGDRLGPRTILSILEGLQACSGDPRYRPSPWLRRRAALGLSLLCDEAR